MSRALCFLLVVVLWQPMPAFASEPVLPPRAEILDRLHAGHPRLLAHRDDFQRLAVLCEKNDRAGRWLGQLRSRAEELLARPPVKYAIPDGKRLLSVSREAKDRLLLLGFMHQLTGEPKYARRAWTELAAVTQFKDWNPAHFLDTAEMTFAVAVGYDWLYDAWQEEERTQLRKAIVRLGLTPGRAVYRNQQWWAKAKHNWNQVCNGGLAVGALAIGDVEPELASEVLHYALQSLPLAMREFAPDGGWGEGPSYWRYATEYNVYLLAALQTALGDDFGLRQMPGFPQTGDFPMHIVGPTGKSFNFADAGDAWQGASQWFWLATQFDRPEYARAQLPYAESRAAPLDLLWGANWVESTEPPPMPPLARNFRGVSVVAMRSAWNDPQALFVACKGGDNRVNHAHLDLSTFVIDALGERWAIDVGPDDYNLPGYFGSQRWSYFRNNSHSHNVVLLDGQSQRPDARAAIVRFAADAGQKWTGAVIDLSQAWPQAQRVVRGVALIAGRQILVQDEIAAPKPCDATWQLLTDAQIEIDGKSAILSKGGRRMRATLLAPESGRWAVEEVVVPPPQRAVPNVRKLLATPAQPAAEIRFAVLVESAADTPGRPPLTPLAEWPHDAAAGNGGR